MKAKPKLIMKGAKVLCLTLGNVKFIDSLSFLTMPLSKIPASMGLDSNLAKGYYPHFFNTTENENYVGPWPEAKYYDPDAMKTEQRETFLAWHAERIASGELFDQNAELLKYCIQDVNILRLGCMKFRELICETAKVDPFLECITLASCCSLIFRRNFLKENVLGILPPKGYRLCNPQSKVAIKWLLWCERELGDNIQHAGRAAEYRLPSGHLVDGYHKQGNMETVYQFLGCRFHGCKSCEPDDHTILYNDPSDTMGLRREKTENMLQTLRDRGYIVKYKWECEFLKEMKENIELCEFVNNHPVVVETPLVARDALYGGRTGVYKRYHECLEDGEQINFMDFISLYPWSCFYFPMPVGHPEVILGPDFPDIATTHGLVKCVVLPPRQLYHPVLPIKLHGKLLFVLCRTCAEEMRQTDCSHLLDSERVLSGTWVAAEVAVAMQMGYQVVRIIEFWKYQVEQYDTQTGLGGIFCGYMKLFLKIKQESSGYPIWCVDSESRERFIAEYFESQGIRLDPSKIMSNPGLRFIAKALMNNLWGRFALNILRSQTVIVNLPSKLFEMLSNPNYEVTSIKCIGEESVVVNYEVFEDVITPDPTVSVVIAAFVTAGARLKLFGYMHILGKRLLYSDTDSLQFTTLRGELVPLTGTGLGELSNELDAYGIGAFIKEFLGGGSKHYGMKILGSNGELLAMVIKCRGITINHRASQVVNFETLKHMILEDDAPLQVTNPTKIMRTTQLLIISKSFSKVYRTVFNKRRRVPDSYFTLPYGFKE